MKPQTATSPLSPRRRRSQRPPGSARGFHEQRGQEELDAYGAFLLGQGLPLQPQSSVDFQNSVDYEPSAELPGLARGRGRGGRRGGGGAERGVAARRVAGRGIVGGRGRR